ncbi:tRNA lysidine(34) synthetase TilS [Acidisphaera sp. S103]|uniref:tRNA lysidine(34) synthetase TilS n=1 Tax=Acidisphaera sp. S103 TaxID=1747223 RepID=UPI00131B9B70|nr:tRNA lysidine(34) synthetase TilS [Acidisphaera sp. S103]
MTGTQPCLAAAFVAAMDRLGPYEPHPALAVAVSGGADSLALAILARDWARRRDGSTLALVVDHGLRPASAGEARITLERLTGLGVPARLLSLSNLKHGPALAERARIMRYEILTDACHKAGILHLLLGHHAADQVETLAMRVLRGSQTHGLAGMAALHETPSLRLLRPLLEVEPALLRDLLTMNGTDWVEDPSNRDQRAMRPRLRHYLARQTPDETRLPGAIAAVARLRAREEAETAAELASRTTIRPEGFALLSPGRISPSALSSLVRTIGGMAHPASPGQISLLAAQPRSATVAGVRIMPAGRFGDGWLVVREEAAVMPPVAASGDITWDHRFRLRAHRTFPSGATIGKLGPDAAGFRDGSDLPSAVLRTLPALRIGKVLAAVPHLGYASDKSGWRITALFSPRKPVAGPCFVPAR